MRNQQCQLMDDNIKAEWLPLFHKNSDEATILKKTPWVGVTSLSAKVQQQLEGLYRYFYIFKDLCKNVCWIQLFLHTYQLTDTTFL